MQQDLVPASRDEQKEETETCGGHMVQAVFVTREPSKGLLANFRVRSYTSLIVAWVAILRAVCVRLHLVSPVKAVDE